MLHNTTSYSGWKRKTRWIGMPDMAGCIRARWQKLRLVGCALWDSWRLRNEPGEKIFIDCGSNLGQGALFFSRFFSPRNWKYILIEPNPACHKTLRRVARQKLSHRGSPAKIIPRAAWISSGERPFYGAEKGAVDVGASLNPLHNSGVQPVRKRVGRMVRTFDLGRFLRDTCFHNQSRPKLCIVLKMDIEGAEIPVLSHLIRSDTLNTLKVLYVEWHSKYLTGNRKMKESKNEKSLKMKASKLTKIRSWL